MSVIQVPPPVGSSGQFIDSLVLTSSTNRQIILIGDSVSSGAFAPVTSSAGQLVSVSSGTFTLSSAPTVNVSSGTFSLSSNITVISASSGFVQISNPTTAVTVNVPTSVVVTPSSNFSVAVTNPTTAVTISNSSFTVNLSTVFSLSSAPLVVVASSGGTIPVSLSTVFSLSSAPLVVVATSGGTISVNTLTSGATVLSSVGVTQAVFQVATGSGVGTVTSSLGVVSQLSYSKSSGRMIIATSVGKISSAPGVLTAITAYTTASTAASVNWLRLYDFTTNNATSSTNSGLSGACFMIRVENAVGNGGVSFPTFSPGLSFATACSFDLVVAATSTTLNALGGWVSAQYTS